MLLALGVLRDLVLDALADLVVDFFEREREREKEK